MTDNIRAVEDQQILAEIATNEKIVEYPTKGKIKFFMPNLDTQRKIDAFTRAKKKFLREATDRIPDPEAPMGYRVVPAYKSREILIREYQNLGWWTSENDDKLKEITTEYINYLTQLELLNFESETAISRDLEECRQRLLKLFEDNPNEEVMTAISIITIPGGDVEPKYISILKNEASTTEVDDLIEKIEVFRKQYDCYMALGRLHLDLIKMEAEKNSLFSDSWQDQLQYFNRLAQVYYCTKKVETDKPLYDKIEDLEKEPDLDFIRWVFTELQSFWQGISDEAKERLAKYSFMAPLNTEKLSSAESPVQPESNKGGDLLVKEPILFYEAMITIPS